MTHARITLRPTPAGLLPRIALLCVLGAATTPATGSSPDTLEAVLPGVTVEASRATETNASAPFAVTIVERSPAQIATESGTSLQDVLAAVPGVWVNDRGHFALGERIIIRGAGWRSAFGVRGVMVVLDGVPLTMPDGQAFADVVEPSLIRSAEIIRGPASVFWGNAAGGVLYLQTRPADTAPALRLRGMVGGYGERHVLAESNISVGRARIAAFASHIGREGYRAHSDGSFQRAGVHARLPVGRRTLVTASAAGAIQDAQNPGGLTADQFQADPRQVDDQYISYQTGKESLQLQAILTVDHALPFGTLSASAYGVRRDLDNPLPFRYVAVDRLAGGARARLTGAPSRRLRWSVGADFGLQQDDRKNFDNASGRPSGDATLDQIEDVTNVAGYAYVSATVLPRLEVSAGMRYDAIRFAMDDHFLENGDESGARRFRAASPSLGVGYRLGTALLFANVSTAFETPTTTELVNRPDATGGFNPELDPERTRGLEVGVRGTTPAGRLRYEAAAFRSNVENILVQSETAESRAYYRNAGTTRHTGAELHASFRPIDLLRLNVTYAINDLLFTDGALDGNALPGVPLHRTFLELVSEYRNVVSSVSLEAAAGYYADEANEEKTDGYALVSIRIGHTGLTAAGARVQPFAEIENVLDADYNASVVVNAFGGRFYEPGYGRQLRAGLNVAF